MKRPTLRRKHFCTRLFFVFLSAIVAANFLACTKSAKTGRLPPVTAGDLKLAVKKSDGCVTLVNLWATWCEPCRREMPELLQFQKRFGEQGVRLILVSMDAPDSLKEAESFLTSLGVSGNDSGHDLRAGSGVLFYRLGEPVDVFNRNFEPKWSAVLPATFVFDEKGEQRLFWVGASDQKQLEKKVLDILKASPKRAAKAYGGT